MISKILGAIILLSCFVIVYLFETQTTAVGWVRIFHWPAIILTGIGPIGLMLIASDFRTIWEALALVSHSPRNMRKTVDNERLTMRELSEKYYTGGSGSFEETKDRKTSRAFRSVLNKLALRIPIPDIRTILGEQQAQTDSDVTRSIGVMALAVKLAPSVGMLGTILGMVNLLSNLDDPSEIGSSMSLALLTTFYGLFFSLAIWTPMQYRLQSMLQIQHQGFDQIDHWLALLETRKPAEYIERESMIGGKNTDDRA
jgi:chemotaxis protein MotA